VRLSFPRLIVPTSLVLALALGACGDSHTVAEADAGPLGSDGGTMSDGSTIFPDSGIATDASVTPIDSSTGDSGGTSVDASTVDSGTIVVDASPAPDGGPMPTVPGSVGAACAGDADCDMLTAPTCMTTIGSGGFSADFPGGYCTQTCMPSFGGGPDGCPTGSSCFGGGFGGFGAAYCAKTCSSDADCRVADGYTCRSAGFGGSPSVCSPPFGGGGMTGGDAGLPSP